VILNWPCAERQAGAVDRSKDPPGAWRGDGNQYLNPEQHAQAKNVIADVRRAEKPITDHMQEVERLSSCGGCLEGLEYRLKNEDRIKEKIADLAGTSAPDVPDRRRSALRASVSHSRELSCEAAGHPSRLRAAS
jgi:hypothetical protein